LKLVLEEFPKLNQSVRSDVSSVWRPFRDTERKGHPMIRTSILVVAAVVMTAASPGPVHAADTGHAAGGILTDKSGMTLYTFDKDRHGVSACDKTCLLAWPPLMATNADKGQRGWSRVKRENGTTQWAYKGRPIYTYALDAKPGDKRGDGAEGTWHIARP